MKGSLTRAFVLFSGFASACGPATKKEETATGTPPTAATRPAALTITGTLPSSEPFTSVIAIEQTTGAPDTASAVVGADRKFSLVVKSGKHYLLSASNKGRIVRTFKFKTDASGTKSTVLLVAPGRLKTPGRDEAQAPGYTESFELGDVGTFGDNDLLPGNEPCGAMDADDDGQDDCSDTDDDNDGTTDATDEDSDGDGLSDDSQDGDFDDDGLSDEVDDDLDGDGIKNSVDAQDYDKENDGTDDAMSDDFDRDGVTNASDTDDDNDGIPDANDCDQEGDGEIEDIDADGTDNDQDSDDDGDGYADNEDNDQDNDGIADADDSDVDGDGIDENITCPANYAETFTACLTLEGELQMECFKCAAPPTCAELCAGETNEAGCVTACEGECSQCLDANAANPDACAAVCYTEEPPPPQCKGEVETACNDCQNACDGPDCFTPPLEPGGNGGQCFAACVVNDCPDICEASEQSACEACYSEHLQDPEVCDAQCISSGCDPTPPLP